MFRVEGHMKNGDALENIALKPFGCDNIPAHVIHLTCGESYSGWLMCDTVEGMSLVLSFIILSKSPTKGLTTRSLRD